MAENIYGDVGAGSVDLADEEQIEPDVDGNSGGVSRHQKRNSYKTQMMRSNIFLIVLFIGGAAAVYGLSLRKGPAEASAEQQTVEIQVDSAILRIANEEPNKAKAPSSGQITSQILENFYDRIAERQIPLSDLKKNPFVFVPTAPPKPIVVKNSSDPKAVEKSPEEKRREETTAAFKTLHLQSVMMGRDGGTALISNNLLTAGQTIEGFKIKSISPRLVVLVRDGKEFVLEMP